MKLDQLLARDADAHAYFASLPAHVRHELRRRGDKVCSLAALREYARDLKAQFDPPSPGHVPFDGIPLDPEQRAEWTRTHQT